jgi:hypothetical protein
MTASDFLRSFPQPKPVDIADIDAAVARQDWPAVAKAAKQNHEAVKAAFALVQGCFSPLAPYIRGLMLLLSWRGKIIRPTHQVADADAAFWIGSELCPTLDALANALAEMPKNAAVNSYGAVLKKLAGLKNKMGAVIEASKT